MPQYKKGQDVRYKPVGILKRIYNSEDVGSPLKELETHEPNGINIFINNAVVALEAGKKSHESSVDYYSSESARSWLEGDGRDVWQQTLISNLTPHYFLTARLIPALDIRLPS
ncbi:hypothetical protein McanCB49686_000369 [Microsporum canis]